MTTRFEVKVRGTLGPEPEDTKEIRILNRTLRWTTRGLELEADGKHVQTVISEMGLETDSKGLDTPLPKEYGAVEGDEALEEWQAKAYRRIAATVNYLA